MFDQILRHYGQAKLTHEKTILYKWVNQGTSLSNVGQGVSGAHPAAPTQYLLI